MIYVRNNDGGLCNRIKLFGQALAFGIEFNQDVTHVYFNDLKKYLELNDTLLPINVFIPETSEKKVRFHNLLKAVKRHVHIGQEENRELLRSKLSAGTTVNIRTWRIREPVGYIRYQSFIAEYLKPRKEYVEYAESVVKEINRHGKTIVGLHMRRGDYKTWKNGIYYYEVPAYLKWIREIVECFGEDVVVALFTNEEFDLENAKKITGYSDLYLMHGNALQDLSTMSLCDYIVGPPSTFSEMAAYYGNRMYLNLESEKQKIEKADFKSLKEIYETFYKVNI